MIRLGKKINQAGDPLTDLAMDKFVQGIKNPHGEVAKLQKSLQAIRSIDANQYRKMKLGLPYVVCAQFHPKLRKKENFLQTERFLLDIDHLEEMDIDILHLREILRGDPRVELLFASPSGDGLKVMFKLDEPIKDSQYYSVFYKAFCQRFEKQYGLGAALDQKTSDVSRCCFVSYDPMVYYNEQATTVIAGDYISQESFWEMDQVLTAAKKIEKEHQHIASALDRKTEVQASQDLPEDVLNFIKGKIGQKVRQPIQKEYEQPEELDAVMEKVNTYLTEIRTEIESVRPISFGRQLKINTGTMWAELNIFYGKRGVSIVATTKSGSHKELGKTLTDYLKDKFMN